MKSIRRIVWQVLALTLTALVAIVLFGYALAQRRSASTTPRPSTAVSNSTSPRNVNLKAGDNLQRALDQARPGDTLVLEAGATFVGPVTLPNKQGDEYVTIQTSALAQLPGEGHRVSPADAVLMPRIVSPGKAEPALRTAAGAHHYRFVGVEFSTVAADSFAYELVTLGNYDNAQNRLDQVPHHLILDRCFIHTYPAQSLKRGLTLNSAETSILNCYISGFKVVGQEAQAIQGWNGPGPFHIINNYLEAAGENIIFGGATASIPGLIPSDIEVRRNYLYKPPSWCPLSPSYAGVHWTVKNLFELKNARRVVVDGNTFENNWLDAQQGYAILFTPRPNDSGSSAVIEDVQFTNNIVRHVAAALFIFGQDSLFTANPTLNVGRRITVRNNLFYDVNAALWGGDGAFLKIGAEARQVTIDHNTVDQTGNIMKAFGAPSPGFVFTNNIAPHNAYGVGGDSTVPGIGALAQYFPGYVFRRNVIAGDAVYVQYHDQYYPPDNLYPPQFAAAGFVNRAEGNYRLLATSPYRKAAMGGAEVGCDLTALATAMGVQAATRPRTVNSRR